MPDVIVLLPGITGSVLSNANGKEVWSLSVGAIWRLIGSRGGSIEDLKLAADGDPGGVTAPRLFPGATIVPGLIKIDGYAHIENYLVTQLGLVAGKNYFPFPYDWRLDNRVNAGRLERLALDWLKAWRAESGAADAKLVLIGHSMGGIVARYFLECLGGWESTRTLITLGTPHRGSLNAVDFLVHGLKKGIGPLGLDLSPLLSSFPSVYQLLPIYPCIDVGGKQLERIADAAEAGHLPHVRADWARDARAFHKEIEDAQAANARGTDYAERGYRLAPLAGIEQPTYQSARSAGGKVDLLRTYNGEDLAGDGTVPRVSATPLEMEKENRELFAAEMHGSLQNGEGTLTNLKGILTQPNIDFSRYREGLPTSLTLDLDDVVLPGEPLVIRAKPAEGNPPIAVTLRDTATGTTIADSLARAPEAGWQYAEFDVAPGTWRVRIEAPNASPVTDLVAVVKP
jgi:pimeloyl-ACP methyl ester carboxylesterase